MSKELNIYQKLNNFRFAVGTIRKDKTNPYHKSKYADINDILEAITQPLSDVGLIDVDTVEVDANGTWWLKTDLVDINNPESKLSIKTPLLLKDPNNPQALGSALTYARRYNRVTLLGLEQEDDDGNAAAGINQNTQKQYPKPQNTQPKTFEEHFKEILSKNGINENNKKAFIAWMKNQNYDLLNADTREYFAKNDIKLKRMIQAFLNENKQPV